MTFDGKNVDCDCCGRPIAKDADCHCKDCYDSVVTQLTEVMRIKRELEAEVAVLKCEKEGAY